MGIFIIIYIYISNNMSLKIISSTIKYLYQRLLSIILGLGIIKLLVLKKMCIGNRSQYMKVTIKGNMVTEVNI